MYTLSNILVRLDDYSEIPSRNFGKFICYIPLRISLIWLAWENFRHFYSWQCKYQKKEWFISFVWLNQTSFNIELLFFTKNMNNE